MLQVPVARILVYNTDSSRLTTVCLVTVRSYAATGKGDLSPFQFYLILFISVLKSLYLLPIAF